MSTDKMPISLLKNQKTVSYLISLFVILDREAGEKAKTDHILLKKKILDWCELKGAMRLDLNALESELFEECSKTAYALATQKEVLNETEKAFVKQHEFFFKN